MGVHCTWSPSPICPRDAAGLEKGDRSGSKVRNSSHTGKDDRDWESSACGADKLKKDVIEENKILSGLEKMNREGGSHFSDPRSKEVPKKPTRGGWEGNKMRYSAPSVHFSFGAWTAGHCIC